MAYDQVLHEKDKAEILQKRRKMEYQKRMEMFTTKFVDKNLESNASSGDDIQEIPHTSSANNKSTNATSQPKKTLSRIAIPNTARAKLSSKSSNAEGNKQSSDSNANIPSIAIQKRAFNSRPTTILASNGSGTSIIQQQPNTLNEVSYGLKGIPPPSKDFYQSRPPPNYQNPFWNSDIYDTGLRDFTPHQAHPPIDDNEYFAPYNGVIAPKNSDPRHFIGAESRRVELSPLRNQLNVDLLDSVRVEVEETLIRLEDIDANEFLSSQDRETIQKYEHRAEKAGFMVTYDSERPMPTIKPMSSSEKPTQQQNIIVGGFDTSSELNKRSSRDEIKKPRLDNSHSKNNTPLRTGSHKFSNSLREDFDSARIFNNSPPLVDVDVAPLAHLKRDSRPSLMEENRPPFRQGNNTDLLGHERSRPNSSGNEIFSSKNRSNKRPSSSDENSSSPIEKFGAFNCSLRSDNNNIEGEKIPLRDVDFSQYPDERIKGGFYSRSNHSNGRKTRRRNTRPSKMVRQLIASRKRMDQAKNKALKEEQLKQVVEASMPLPAENPVQENIVIPAKAPEKVVNCDATLANPSPPSRDIKKEVEEAINSKLAIKSEPIEPIQTESNISKNSTLPTPMENSNVLRKNSMDAGPETSHPNNSPGKSKKIAEIPEVKVEILEEEPEIQILTPVFNAANGTSNITAPNIQNGIAPEKQEKLIQMWKLSVKEISLKKQHKILTEKIDSLMKQLNEANAERSQVEQLLAEIDEARNKIILEEENENKREIFNKLNSSPPSNNLSSPSNNSTPPPSNNTDISTLNTKKFFSLNVKLPNEILQQHLIPLQDNQMLFSKHLILEKTFAEIPEITDSLADFLKLVFQENKGAIEFLVRYRLLANSRKCEKCARDMTIQKCTAVNDGIQWSCRVNRNTRCSAQAIRNGSIFSYTKISFAKCLLLMYFWAQKSFTPEELAKEIDVNIFTINLWINSIRDVCVRFCKTSALIGGIGVIVEIEEFCLKSSKLEDVWIFAGVERHPTGRVFAKLMADRSENTLQQLFLSSIAPGSIIVSNMGFCSLKMMGYSHYTVDNTLKNTPQTLRGVLNANLIQDTNKINEFTRNLCNNYTNMFKGAIEGFISEEVFRHHAKIASKSVFNFLLDNIAQTYIFMDSPP